MQNFKEVSIKYEKGEIWVKARSIWLRKIYCTNKAFYVSNN